MATVEAPSTPAQAKEEFKVRVIRTLKQVVGAFVLVTGPLVLNEIRPGGDGVDATEAKAFVISGATAAATLAIATLVNYFRPVQTNP